MFLLPSLAAGFVLAVLLGGDVRRLLDVRFRLSWTVLAAFGIQIVLFSRLGAQVPDPAQEPLHLASYGLLIAFAAANIRVRALVLVVLGMLTNFAAIAANGGKMPLSESAASAVGLDPAHYANVSQGADRLWFLGDIFAIPSELPLANAFSIGDVLIGVGMVAFIVLVSVGDGAERPLDPSRLLAPLAVHSYRRLLAGRCISQLGDWLTLAALVGWIYEATGSIGHVAGLMLIRLAPPILGGSVAAVAVDRLPKERLLVWVELGRGVAVAGALTGVLLESRPAVFAALAVSGSLAALSSAAIPALVPSLLPAASLSPANAGVGIANNASMAVGAGGAGLALASVGAPAALLADILTFVLAAALYRGLRPVLAAVRVGARAAGSPSGLRYLVRRRRLLLLVLSFAAATLATGLANVSLPRFLDADIGLGPEAYGFGLAALGAGLALGQILVGLSRVGRTGGRWIGTGLLVMAGLFMFLALGDHAPTAFLVLGAIGFVDGITDVLFETVVQREADPRYYGAIFGFASALMLTTMMGAAVLAAIGNELLGSRQVITAAAFVLVAAGAIGLAGLRGRPGELGEVVGPATASLPARVGSR